MKIKLSKLIHYTFISFLLISLFFSSCKKEDDVSTNPSYKLEFSTDTIIFDTVFATVGSTTHYLKVYNRNDSKVKIASIFLANGINSQYKINIDGLPAVSITDIELAKDDSLYIFVKVTVDPTNQNSPLIISDSIIFETNGNLQDVDLVAWGQDAHYFVGNKYIEGLSYPYIIVAGENETVTWEDDKPYVIYNWAVVDSAGVLNIGPGVDIHFHQNSGLWIYRGGSIHVNGEKDSVVTFQGDRLEYEFRDLPGQWDRIWINEGSVNNEFNYAVIKNGFIGIQAETLIPEETMSNFLILNNTIIKNMSLLGLFTVAYRVLSANSVFANCAENTLFISKGGYYDFRQCTFANYWSHSVRLYPSFILSNQDVNGNLVTLPGDLENAYFGNCIIYGNVEEEILLAKDNQAEFNYKFDHCILKTQSDISDPNFYFDCLKNADPKFVDYLVNDYQLDTLSPAIDTGSMEVINSSVLDITIDLNGNSRILENKPDLGAYEFIIPKTKSQSHLIKQ